MGTRLADRVAIAALLALAGCGDSRASQASASANAAVAAHARPAPADAVHYVRAVTEPYPRNGYCTLGACNWFETRSQQMVGSSEHERQIRVTLASGRSSHPDNAWPADASNAPVRWTSEREEAYVFCSPWRPAVTRRRGQHWEQARVDLIGGMGDFAESSRSIYGLVCHLGYDWTATGFFARRGYRPQAGEPVVRVADPENRTYVYPHDPERPEMGGMAVSHSMSGPPMTVRLDLPPPSAIDARPMADRAEHFELMEPRENGMLHVIGGPYPSAAECERARVERWGRDRSPTHCVAGERRTIR